MTITAAIILFIIFILVYMIIAEIFIVLFKLAGLTDEKARFQVISLLTNSGYTTAESELITSSKIRRRLARLTMLFGYSFTVTIVSVVVNLLIALPQAQLENIGLGALVGGMILVLFIGLIQFIGLRKKFDNFIERLGNKFMFGEGSNPVMVLDTYGENVMAEIQVEHIPPFLKGKTLIESGLKQNYNIQVVLMKRKGVLMSIVNGFTQLEEKDRIVVFGNYKTIRHLFEKTIIG